MSDPLPDHLAALGPRWAVWRWVAVRGAGLPAELLTGLSFPAAAAGTNQAVDEAIRQSDQQLRVIARHPSFREALTWQNRHALHTGVDMLLARPPDATRNRRHRAKEALVASYVQRYCAKNDTIGFFGPLGWARVVDSGPPLTVEAGPQLLEQRTAYLDVWCVDRIAEQLATDAQLLPWLAPRMVPYLRLDGDTLRVPLTGPVTLAPHEAAVLRRCDGRRSAREIAAELAGLPGLDLTDAAAVYAVLRRLRSANRVVWTLEVPADDPDPEQTLRAQLAQVEPAALREPAERVVDALAGHRRAIGEAAGDPDRLDAAVATMEDWFTRHTNDSATRRHGQASAGRALVYEDCRRGVRIHIGPDLLARVGPPLELVLTAGRWFTHRAIQRYRDAVTDLYHRLAARVGRPVPFVDLWLYAQDLLFGPRDELLRELAVEVRHKWAAVLEGGRKWYSADELRPRVAEVFATPGRTEGVTRYCCPDIMIAASGAEAIRSGDYTAVLGELHAGINTYTTAALVRLHPSPGELLSALDHDLPRPQVAPVYSRAAVPSRLARGLVRPDDQRLVFAQDTGAIRAGRAIPIGSLLVEATDSELTVSTHDGAVRFEVMEVLGELAMIRAHREFGIQSQADHTGRLTIDDLVVERERWRFQAEDLSFAWITDERSRFLAAHEWRQARGIPRHVFVQAGHHTKPYYVDFAAPAILESMARSVRRATTDSQPVSVSEMLPTPDQLWLPDAAGRRYTSELRLIAIERP